MSNIGRRQALFAVSTVGLLVAGQACDVDTGDPGSIDSKIDDLVARGGARLDGAASDRGRMVTRTPHAVVRPRTADEVARTIRYAGDAGMSVRPRGAAHSTFGQSQTDGIVVDTTELNHVGKPEGEVLNVGAGATWGAVLNRLMPLGWMPRYLPQDLTHTVGGSIAADLISTVSQSRGGDVENIHAMDVVTGAGELIRCATSYTPSLFEAVAGGMGSPGIIVGATLALVPWRTDVRRYTRVTQRMGAWLAGLAEMAESSAFDAVVGRIVTKPDGGWIFMADGYVFFDQGAAPDDARKLGMLRSWGDQTHVLDDGFVRWASRWQMVNAYERSTGLVDVPHPSLELALPHAGAEKVLSRLLSEIDQDELASFHVAVTPILGGSSRRLRGGPLRESTSLVVSVERACPPGTSIDAMLDFNVRQLERALAVGGAATGACALPYGDAAWFPEREAWRREMRNTFDPAGVLSLA
jgi:cytokinin dehydrogenase